MNTPGTAPAELRSFVERIQRLEGEIAEINSDKRDVYMEAKSKGFDVAALKAVVSYLRKDREKAEERQSVFDLYLGYFILPSFGGTESATRARARPNPIAAPTSDEADIDEINARSIAARTKKSPIAAPTNPRRTTRGDEAVLFSSAPQKAQPSTASPISEQFPPLDTGHIRERPLSHGLQDTVPAGRSAISEAAPSVFARIAAGDVNAVRDALASEAAPIPGVVGGDRTDAASSHSAVTPTRVSSLATRSGGGNLAGTVVSADSCSPLQSAGHSLSETDAVGTPVSSIAEPAHLKVSTHTGEIEPVREAGLGAGSPLSETDAVVGLGGSIAEPAHLTALIQAEMGPVRETGSDAGSPIPESERATLGEPDFLDIRNQPFYRGAMS